MTNASRHLLSKFDVAERQLNQAIRLFFEGGDPVSIHTLAEAASQVLYDIRSRIGAQSKIRDGDIIKPEFKKEWTAALARSRNFFKHADRDADSLHEFKDEFNDFSLLDAVNMYLSGKAAWTPETIVFIQWFSLQYPNLVRKETPFAALIENARASQPQDPVAHRALCARAIRELRSGLRSVPGVTLAPSLPGAA